MYVLFCPCIQDAALRARGITRPSDLALFDRVRERCRKFSVEMVPFPCPETLFLGPDREPGTFLERLDKPEFPALLDRLEAQVREMIARRGQPLCIIGVNSSPTCGVTATYYGSNGEEPPKRPGRGVFLDRFCGIRAFDVTTFSRYRIYLAAPLFSQAERTYNATLARLLETNLFEVYLPQETGDDSDTRQESEQHRLFRQNVEALEASDIVVAVIEGADADSGTAWEMGYASARGKPVIAIRTDFRRVGHHEHVNLMLEQSAVVVTSSDDLFSALHSPLLPGPDG
ncbi:MAG: nucleoside 2-deoxyribosyltransferase [Methanomicrobiales archaeon]|nr:nucleoside 2-deoxyribosyltransferase [Methanomicrobiales archaeon]